MALDKTPLLKTEIVRYTEGSHTYSDMQTKQSLSP